MILIDDGKQSTAHTFILVNNLLIALPLSTIFGSEILFASTETQTIIQNLILSPVNRSLWHGH
ncbi:hypothetical protein BpHYR1_022658 [Brachionus plicatilis]|uniref:Uncharacterized protein n=1 Tax=Brachionus plicatilis TaxID=10195 RepID=A0A3M7P390_BRAPC|nr:hypothetical protein BpHYR1_022658 [Brachionus plicatilis]